MRRASAVGAAAVTVLLLAACGQRAGRTGVPRSAVPLPDDGALVLRIQLTGGFTPLMTGLLPLVSVYADGRVITEGPVPAIYPGFALPNLLVRRIDRAAVQGLADRALAAGLTEASDLGRPPVMDATTTRFTLVTAAQTYVREAYALFEAPRSDPSAPSRPATSGGLTADQLAARARLLDLRNVLSDLPGSLGAGRVGAEQPYRPAAVAAVARAYRPPDDGLVQPEVRWPGPALPGEPMAGGGGLSCLTVTGEQAGAVLAAAANANTLTPWVGEDGARWQVTFRPLLPDESGCADLA